MKRAKICAISCSGRLIGGTIGFFLGSLCGLPMLGDFLGSFIGDIIANTIAALLLDDEQNRPEFTEADFERELVTLEEKKAFYFDCMRNIGLALSEDVETQRIKDKTKFLCLENHPEKREN